MNVTEAENADVRNLHVACEHLALAFERKRIREAKCELEIAWAEYLAATQTQFCPRCGLTRGHHGTCRVYPIPDVDATTETAGPDGRVMVIGGRGCHKRIRP